jgi:sensor domain CHASE-containing protein
MLGTTVWGKKIIGTISYSLDLQDRPTILACVPPSPTTYITDIYSYKGTKYDFYGFYAFFLPAGGLYAGYG